MEPQPGSPASPHSSATPSSPGSAKVTPPFDDMPAPDEPIMEEATGQEPDRKSTSSSSSSSSSESSAESPRHVRVIELGVPLVPAPEDEQAVASSPVHSAGGKPDEWATLEDDKAAALPERSAEAEADDDRALPEDEQTAAQAVHSAEVKPDDWATWPEPPPPPSVDDSFASDGSAGATTGPTEAPQVQTMSKPEGVAAGAGASEFDPQRIPASVFQPTRTSLSQAEWSMTSNESLFSIQGASDVGGPYASSRSHFDFFFDEAMAAAEADSKLPTVAEGTEPGELAVDSSKEFTVPGSAGSQASAGSPSAKKAAAVFRRDESGSGGSSSNFSFAFPILAPTSPKKRDLVSSALYQPLEKECEQPPPQLEPPVSAFVEMTTEAERRGAPAAAAADAAGSIAPGPHAAAGGGVAAAAVAAAAAAPAPASACAAGASAPDGNGGRSLIDRNV